VPKVTAQISEAKLIKADTGMSAATLMQAARSEGGDQAEAASTENRADVVGSPPKDVRSASVPTSASMLLHHLDVAEN
jgi:hypothetical protein